MRDAMGRPTGIQVERPVALAFIPWYRRVRREWNQVFSHDTVINSVGQMYLLKHNLPCINLTRWWQTMAVNNNGLPQTRSKRGQDGRGTPRVGVNKL